jgi:hypothetical protein
MLRVAPPNSNVATDDVPSHLALKTRALQSSRRVISHCAHYYFNRVCNRGSECYFIHAISLVPKEDGAGEENSFRRIWGRTQQKNKPLGTGTTTMNNNNNGGANRSTTPTPIPVQFPRNESHGSLYDSVNHHTGNINAPHLAGGMGSSYPSTSNINNAQGHHHLIAGGGPLVVSTPTRSTPPVGFPHGGGGSGTNLNGMMGQPSNSLGAVSNSAAGGVQTNIAPLQHGALAQAAQAAQQQQSGNNNNTGGGGAAPPSYYSSTITPGGSNIATPMKNQAPSSVINNNNNNLGRSTPPPLQSFANNTNPVANNRVSPGGSRLSQSPSSSNVAGIVYNNNNNNNAASPPDTPSRSEYRRMHDPYSKDTNVRYVRSPVSQQEPLS